MGGPLVGAVDEGTTSTRFTVYDEQGKIVATSQRPVPSIHPQEGWVEQDPMAILEAVQATFQAVVDEISEKGYSAQDIKAIGITNQRETVVVWDKVTGTPFHNAIVWMDVRASSTVDRLIEASPTRDQNCLQRLCGLPLSTYFSAVKLRWLLDNVDIVREEAAQGRCLFGTIDTWLLWNLTGGKQGGIHVTDVTNASRTMLMNIRTLKWDQELLNFFNISETLLPEIKSSSEIYGRVASGPLQGVAIAGCLGDQHAALLGQLCLKTGTAKNTYGTGCFLLYNTGNKPVFSRHGLLTTVAFKLGANEECSYALEGSIGIAGAAMEWMKDGLGIVDSVQDIEPLANDVDGVHGVYFVPAFNGLLAPHWRHDARGLLIGISQYTTKNHIARAALEAVSFQSREVLEAMNKDSGIPLSMLKVDGGMTQNNLLMQIQADLLGIDVVRPQNIETTSLGAATAAAIAAGIDLWKLESLAKKFNETTFRPQIEDDERTERYTQWKRAVSRSIGWLRPSETLGGTTMDPSKRAAVPMFEAVGRKNLRFAGGMLLFVSVAAVTIFCVRRRVSNSQ